MNTTTALLGLLAVLATATAAHAHGGLYRAPGSVIPPSSSGGSAGSGTSPAPGPSGPTGLPNSTTTIPRGPLAPATGPSAGTAGLRGSAAAGPIGVEIGDDLTRWSYFWEFRKDSFLRLKRAVHETGVVRNSDQYFMGWGSQAGSDTLEPTRAQVLGEIVPALHRTLEATQQRDITSACLVALAKIGQEDPRYHALLPTLRTYLKSHDQEIRETAALALGISQRSAAIPDLVALLADDEDGRALVDRAEVDYRTRAFAAYGLGLVASATPSPAVGRIVLDALVATLRDGSIVAMDVPIACITAIGLLAPDPDDPRSAALLADALAVLRTTFDADLGVGRQLIQAHVPPAAANLVRRAGDAKLRDAWCRRFAEELRASDVEDASTRRNRALAQSAVLALGELAAPNEPGANDAWLSDALRTTFETGKDAQTASFALVALGRIGGSVNRTALLDVLRTGKKALEKPWAALALGLHEQARRKALGVGARTDAEIVTAITAQLDEVRNPDALGAFAIALGLAGATDEAPRLRELLVANRHQDELAGYLCLGLGLMRDRGSLDTIREIATSSARRPQLVLQAAIALGRLGDKTVALQFVDQMGASDQNLAVLASLAFAVGQIGDRRSVAPLVEMLEDTERSDLARAFAAVSLGGVADKELEPWNAKIGRLVNYRAAVDTLTNQASGILDIL